MEQWNNEQEILSLRRILELRYLAILMDRKNLAVKDLDKISELEESSLTEVIDAVLIDCCDGKETDKEEFIKSHNKALFDMLDAVIPNIRMKLKNEKGRYGFNLANMDFINRLLDYNDEGDPNCKNLKKRNYDKINYDLMYPSNSDELNLDFRTFLYKGLIGLAENTELQKEEVEREWDWRFNPNSSPSNQIVKLEQSLAANIEFYVGELKPEEENLEILEKMKEILEKCYADIEKVGRAKIEFTYSDTGEPVEDEVAFVLKEYKMYMRARKKNKRK